MSNFQRKLARSRRDFPLLSKPPQKHGEWISNKGIEAIKQQVTADVSEQAIYKVLMVATDVLWHDWGALHKKETRLKVFSDLFRQRLEVIGNPDERQKISEKEFNKQTGWTMIRD